MTHDPQSGKNFKILIIDDSEIVRGLLALHLSGAGYEVTTLDTQFATASAILRERPALVLLDVSMPGLDGDEIVRVIRGTSSLRQTTVVLHSDKPEAELRSITDQCGADGYIVKTQDPKVLVCQVERWVPRRGQR